MNIAHETIFFFNSLSPKLLLFLTKNWILQPQLIWCWLILGAKGISLFFKQNYGLSHWIPKLLMSSQQSAEGTQIGLSGAKAEAKPGTKSGAMTIGTVRIQAREWDKDVIIRQSRGQNHEVKLQVQGDKLEGERQNKSRRNAKVQVREEPASKHWYTSSDS